MIPLSTKQLPGRDKVYVAVQGDMLDRICWLHYGKHTSEVVQGVLRRNQNVGKRSAKLDVGDIIVLPYVPPAADVAPIVIYDETAIPVVIPEYVKPIVKTPVSLVAALQQYIATKNTSHSTVTLVSHTAPQHGQLVTTDDEVYRYIPNPGFVGVDSFQLKATDGSETDIDTIEVAVFPSGLTQLFTVYTSDERVLALTRLLFGATIPTMVTRMKALISRSEDSSTYGSDIAAYVEVAAYLRRVDGSTVKISENARLSNTQRELVLQLDAGVTLLTGECVAIRVEAITGNVWGLSFEVTSVPVESNV